MSSKIQKKVNSCFFFSFKSNLKMVNYQKSENITLNVFSIRSAWSCWIFYNCPFFYSFGKKSVILSTCFNFLSWVSFTIHNKLSWNSFKHIFFFMKITTWTIQTPRTIPKLVTNNIARWRQILSKPVFLKIQLHIHFWSKCQKKTFFLVQCYFSNPTIWSQHPSISEHPNFFSIPFQFKE